MKKLWQILLAAYALLLVAYGIFSYALTDPNLVLLTWQPYWQFQQWMWHTFFVDAPLMTEIFTILFFSLFAVYALLAKKLPSMPVSRKSIVVYALLILPLVLSYNALSHDVFNYIFNAKMILVYHVDPYQKMPFEVGDDPWLRFMHNTQSYAPYGYGWTVFSFLPYSLGFGKFLPTWFIFRLLSVLSIGLLYFSLQSLAQELLKRKLSVAECALVFLNPLFLIEIVSNSHNDLWMMAPGIFAMALVISQKKSFPKIVLSFLLLAFSASVKFVTGFLFPIWFFFVLEKKLPVPQKIRTLVNTHWPTFASVLLFLPLLTIRSQQFNPWYLVWVFVWLPFITYKPWRYGILFFSFTSLLRYIPWLLVGHFSEQVVTQQKIITWLAAAPLIILVLSSFFRTKSVHKNAL